MENLAQILTREKLERLRAHYRSSAVLDLKVQATSVAHPPHAPWVEAIRASFYERSALPGRERELCIIALLAYRAPTSLGTHVYAGLMEGLSVEEICEAIGISGCYGGLPAYTDGVTVVRKTLAVLERIAGAPNPDPRTVLMSLVAELSE